MVTIPSGGFRPAQARIRSSGVFRMRGLHRFPVLMYFSTPERWSRPDAPAMFGTMAMFRYCCSTAESIAYFQLP